MRSWRCRTRGHIVSEVELIEVPTHWTPVWGWQGRLEQGAVVYYRSDVCVLRGEWVVGQDPNKELKARELAQTHSLAHGARRQSPIAHCWQCQVHILRISVSNFFLLRTVDGCAVRHAKALTASLLVQEALRSVDSPKRRIGLTTSCKIDSV